MVKTIGSLFSQRAHGSLSKVLTYSKRRSGQQVRRYNKPLAVPSAKQRGQRRLTEFLVAHWQNMTTAERATWEANAKTSDRNLPGYQYFLREAQRDLYTHHGLCGYWHCNEIVGGKILDLSGNGNHGTLQPSYPSNAPVLVNSKNLKVGRALKYDGVDEYVQCGHGASLYIPNTITIACLIKSARTDSEDIFISKGSHKTDGWYFWNHFGIWKMAINKAGSVELLLSGITLTLDTWIDIVATLNNTTLRMKWYKNGQPITTTVLPWALDINAARNLTFGQYTLGGYWSKASIDEICLYKRIFSDAEVASRHKFTLQKVG